MAYWRNAPEEAFSFSLTTYNELIKEAMESGYTKDQAIELLKVWALLAIAAHMEK